MYQRKYAHNMHLHLHKGNWKWHQIWLLFEGFRAVGMRLFAFSLQANYICRDDIQSDLCSLKYLNIGENLRIKLFFLLSSLRQCRLLGVWLFQILENTYFGRHKISWEPSGGVEDSQDCFQSNAKPWKGWLDRWACKCPACICGLHQFYTRTLISRELRAARVFWLTSALNLTGFPLLCVHLCTAFDHSPVTLLTRGAALLPSSTPLNSPQPSQPLLPPCCLLFAYGRLLLLVSFGTARTAGVRCSQL